MRGRGRSFMVRLADAFIMGWKRFFSSPPDLAIGYALHCSALVPSVTRQRGPRCLHSEIKNSMPNRLDRRLGAII